MKKTVIALTAALALGTAACSPQTDTANTALVHEDTSGDTVLNAEDGFTDTNLTAVDPNLAADAPPGNDALVAPDANTATANGL